MKRELANKILFVGDSLVEGFGVEIGDNWVSLVREKLFPLECLNYGRNGMATDQVISLLKGLLKKDQYKKVVILCGANDFIQGKSVPYVIDKLKEMEEMVLESGSSPILILPSTPAFEADFPFVSMASLRSLEEKILEMNSLLGDRALVLSKVLGGRDDLFFDGIHPTEEGHKIIADAFLEYFE